MRFHLLSSICAILLILLGLTVIAGWVLHVPAMVQIMPGLVAMVFNSAILFVVTGFLLILMQQSHGRRHFWQYALSLFILCVAGLSLWQDIFNYDFGIDRLIIDPWAIDPNPTPGRMAPNTALGFILAGLVALILPYAYKNTVDIAIQLITFLIFIIGLVGLLVYSLKLEFILSWYHYTRMSVPTAIGFIILSIGLFCIWSQKEWFIKFYQGKEDKKIIFITGTILLCLTLVAGLGSAAALTYMNISSVNQSLEKLLHTKLKLFQANIDEVMTDVNKTISNTLVINSFTAPSNDKNLKKITDSLFKKGFTAIQFRNANNQILLSKGEFQQNFEIAILLNLPEKPTLFWFNGFWLHLHTPISVNQTLLGYFIAEIPLRMITNSYKDYSGLGNSGEIAICAPMNEYAHCFPVRFNEKPFIAKMSHHGKEILINYALLKQIGIVHSVDRHGHSVVAAYSAIDNLGLLMAIKIDTDEIYKPINDQLRFILPISVLLIFGGLILLYWQVVPIIRKVVVSEHTASEANNKLAASLSQLNKRNQELSLLRELSANLQTCVNLEEALKLIAKYAHLLMQNTMGILYLMNVSQDSLEAVLYLRKHPLKNNTFELDECWALRRGRIHLIENTHVDLICDHLKPINDKFIYICIPLLNHNIVIGLFCLEVISSEQQTDKNILLLATTFCEQIALGISNIKLREELHTQSIHDPLTGLYNRRFLEVSLRKSLLQAERQASPLSVLMIDIDYFKEFNDRYGHEAGDQTLKDISQLIEDHNRFYDFACRFGGEEFILIMPNASEKLALQRANELHKALKESALIHGLASKVPITISIGIACYPQHGKTMQGLINAADLALYRAKSKGRNQTVLF